MTRVSESPLRLSIQATGLAATSGWTNPRLDGSADPNPADAVFEFSFDADRPTGIALEALTPITAALHVDAPTGVDAVIVSSRTNSITVHSSQFVPIPTAQAAPVTTLAIGEEGHVTSMAIGEEGPTTNPQLVDPFGSFGRF